MRKDFLLCRGLSLLLTLLLTLALVSFPASAEGPAETASTEQVIGTAEADISDHLLQFGGFPKAAPKDSAALLADWDGAKSAIEEGLRSWAETIDVSAYGIPNTDDAGRLYWDVVSGDPEYAFIGEKEFFYVAGHISWTYDLASGMLISYHPEYDSRYDAEDAAALEEKLNEFRQTASSIASQVDPAWDAPLKLLFLHDYIVTHCQYDLTYSNYNAYNVLVEHSAVCQGYSLAFQYLARLVGIETWIVSSEQIDHAWNLVPLGGMNFYVDCTWDDPLYALDESGKTHFYEGYCGHTNFLRSYAGICETGHASTDWVLSEWYWDAPSTDGDDYFEGAFWKNVITPVAFLEGAMAYSYSNDRSNVSIWDLDQDAETVYPLGRELTWYVWDGEGYFWLDNYSTFAVLEGEVYFSTPTELVHLWPDGLTETVYTLSAEEAEQGYIYGVLAQDGALWYSVGPVFYGESGDFLRRSFVPPSADPVRSVTLNKSSLQLLAGGEETLTAQVDAVADADRTVTWTSSDPSVAAVDQNGTVTAVGGGSAVITAAAGNKSAECSVTVTVPVSTVTLDRTELTLYVGDSETLLATVEPENATHNKVSWLSSAPSVLTVDDRGNVKAVGSGTAEITASADGESAGCKVTVEEVPESALIASAAASEGSVLAEGYAGEANTRLVFAVYDAQDRMIQCRAVELPESGGWRRSADFTCSFDRARVFLLDGENRPLCESRGT